MLNIQKQVDSYSTRISSPIDLPDDVRTQIVRYMPLSDFMEFLNVTKGTRSYFLGEKAESVWRRYLPFSCQKSIENKRYEEWPPEYQQLVPLHYRGAHCPIQGLVRKIWDVATDVLNMFLRRSFQCFDLHDAQGNLKQRFLWDFTALDLEKGMPFPPGFSMYTDTNGATHYVDKRWACRLFRHISRSRPTISWRNVFDKPLDSVTWLAIEALCDDGTLRLDRGIAFEVARLARSTLGVPQSLWARIVERAPPCASYYRDASPEFIFGLLKAHPSLLLSKLGRTNYVEDVLQLFGPEKLREVSLSFRVFGRGVVHFFNGDDSLDDRYLRYLDELLTLFKRTRRAHEFNKFGSRDGWYLGHLKTVFKKEMQQEREDSEQALSNRPLAPDEQQLLPCVQRLIAVGKTAFTSSEMVRSFVLAVLTKQHNIRSSNANVQKSDRRHLASAITYLETWLEGRIDALLDGDGSPFNTSDEFEDGATFDQIVGMVCGGMSNSLAYTRDRFFLMA